MLRVVPFNEIPNPTPSGGVWAGQVDTLRAIVLYLRPDLKGKLSDLHVHESAVCEGVVLLSTILLDRKHKTYRYDLKCFFISRRNAFPENRVKQAREYELFHCSLKGTTPLVTQGEKELGLYELRKLAAERRLRVPVARDDYRGTCSVLEGYGSMAFGDDFRFDTLPLPENRGTVGKDARLAWLRSHHEVVMYPYNDPYEFVWAKRCQALALDVKRTSLKLDLYQRAHDGVTGKGQHAGVKIDELLWPSLQPSPITSTEVVVKKA